MFYGLDIHKQFIQVCRIDDEGKQRCDFRIDADRQSILGFAASLTEGDAVALEATFHSWAIWSLLSGHGTRVVVANSMQVKAIAHARVKTDKIDAHILAQLLRADFIPEVQMPDVATWELRQLMTHRQLLVRQRTAARNAVCGILNRKLLTPALKELFGPSGRRWILAQHYTDIERLMLDNDLAHLDALDERLGVIDAKLRELASHSLNVKLLMTIPGVNVTVAIGLVAAIGDIDRFDSPQQLASYFGLVPRVYQSAGTCHHGGITKQGRSQARWLAVEAAHCMVNSGAPLTASYHRLRRKKSHNVAVVALARKLVVVAWHLLTRQEPYRYAPARRTRAKLRRVSPGLAPAKTGCIPDTLESVYAEIGLPESRPATTGEQRAAANSRRTVTRLRQRQANGATSA